MNDESKEQPLDLRSLEKWLEQYFLDPLTNYLDETAFRIDMFETEQEIIIEALLAEFPSSQVTVFLEDKSIIISAVDTNSATPQLRRRTVTFPFSVVHKHVHATFAQGILEIFLSKTKAGPGQNRFVTLP
ncbi:heat-shock protein Hsp20 [Bacillus sp. V3-13]|uniref:Hsp20/alpha crystallin family protein n=1 Tax=Bacillus sp. V3-13 TaxID=2053728 RepID=UPI000C7824EC|nr:Hsp20/alpha crystallin family protein [Bacillus sp. V3-13]PLR78570.1 heat-shock protein Hsp20 [Bacillus sp. V3-13]